MLEYHLRNDVEHISGWTAVLALGRPKEEDYRLMANPDNTVREPVSYKLSDKLHTRPGLDDQPRKKEKEKDAEEPRSQIRLDRTHDS